MRLKNKILPFRRIRLSKYFIISITVLVLYQAVTLIRKQRIPVSLTHSSNNGTLNSLGKGSLDVLHDNIRPTKSEQVSTSGLNLHIWYDLCPSSVQTLCNSPLFPKAPNKKTFTISKLDLTRREENYAQRMFGFLHPPKTGKYRFAIASDDSSELWLSPSEDPSSAVLICNVGERNEISMWTKRGEFHRWSSQISRDIELQENRKYYMEILHVQSGWDDFVNVAWIVPGMKVFKTIQTKSTSLFFNDSGTLNNYDMAPASAACKLRSHDHRRLRAKVKGSVIPTYLPHEDVKDVLPYCDYKPSQGLLTSPSLVHVDIYPPVEYKEVNDYGYQGHYLDTMTTEKVASLYTDSLHQHYPG